MAVDALSASSNAQSAKPNKFSDLNSEQFIKIIFAELQNQDPLKPNDSNQLIQEMANLRSIQSDIDLSKKLETLVTENQLASAGNLIGTSISGLNSKNDRVEGLVVSISRTPDGPILNLHTGERVALKNVDEVIDPRLLQQTPAPTTPAPTTPAPAATVNIPVNVPIAAPAAPSTGQSVTDTLPAATPAAVN